MELPPYDGPSVYFSRRSHLALMSEDIPELTGGCPTKSKSILICASWGLLSGHSKFNMRTYLASFDIYQKLKHLQSPITKTKDMFKAFCLHTNPPKSVFSELGHPGTKTRGKVDTWLDPWIILQPIFSPFATHQRFPCSRILQCRRKQLARVVGFLSRKKRWMGAQWDAMG